MRTCSTSVLLALFIVLGIPTASAEKPEPVTFHWKKKESGHTIEILIVEVPFEKSLHKIQAGNGNVASTIDGVEPWGSDGMIPQTELATFTVKWDGKNIPVPEKLWKDCFNLYLQPYQEPKFPEPGDEPFVKVTEDGNYAIFSFSGSDGAGAYGVTWILAKNGQHARWITAY